MNRVHCILTALYWIFSTRTFVYFCLLHVKSRLSVHPSLKTIHIGFFNDFIMLCLNVYFVNSIHDLFLSGSSKMYHQSFSNPPIIMCTLDYHFYVDFCGSQTIEITCYSTISEFCGKKFGLIFLSNCRYSFCHCEGWCKNWQILMYFWGRDFWNANNCKKIADVHT